jgi:hypothetical protein
MEEGFDIHEVSGRSPSGSSTPIAMILRKSWRYSSA